MLKFLILKTSKIGCLSTHLIEPTNYDGNKNSENHLTLT